MLQEQRLVRVRQRIGLDTLRNSIEALLGHSRQGLGGTLLQAGAAARQQEQAQQGGQTGMSESVHGHHTGRGEPRRRPGSGWRWLAAMSVPQ